MAGTLSEKLVPRLLAHFPDRGVRLHQGKQPVASFPAAHPEVGELQIHDDGWEELTIFVGELAHGHFSPLNDQEPQEKREEELINEVMEFLAAVFDDQVVFWINGWYPRGEEPIWGPGVRKYVWSGPLTSP